MIKKKKGWKRWIEGEREALSDTQTIPS